MSAARRKKSHETGDAKMKMAAIKSVKTMDKPAAVPSPAKALQSQLEQHYQPLSRRMSVILISVMVAFAFIGGWIGGSGAISIV
ncbi:MAG: hypothetical protein AAF437_09400 [Pseudomonadota bacterium]